MDTVLLTFFNKTLAHPLLDFLMIGFTLAAYLVLPGIAVLFLYKKERRIGWTLLASVALALAFALMFQFLGQRPRPEDIRLIWPQPGFPAYPSGHTATAFAAATVIALAFRQLRWQIISVAVAILISLSRLYLGAHYFSDVAGGAILGASIGATCYGLFITRSTGPLRWRWFLWPQLAVVIILTQMSYLNLPAKGSDIRVFVKGLEKKSFKVQFESGSKPTSSKTAAGKPKFKFRPVDDIIHFLFFGAVAFWLNIWVNGRRVRLLRFQIPMAILLPFTCAIIEESMQFFSPHRTVSIWDLTFDLVGMIFFCWLSYKLLRRWEEAPYHEPKEKYLESVSN